MDAPPAQKPSTNFPPPATGTFPAPAGPSGDMGDIPGLLAAADDDPFANIDLEGPASLGAPSAESFGYDGLGDPSEPLPAFDPGPLAGLALAPGQDAPARDSAAGGAANGSGTGFDLSDSLAPIAAEVGEPPLELDTGPALVGYTAEPIARLDLRKQATDPRAHRVPTAVIKAHGGTDPALLEKEGEGRWPTLAGILLGLMVLVFLLPDLGQRAIEALLPRDWGVEWEGAVAAPVPVQVNRAKVTAYPVRDGREVLVVAGDARNRTERLLSGVEVVVEVYDGGRKVDERRGLVDVVLNEGQLSRLSTADELQAAYDDAVRAHGERGAVLPPASERPFMVVFPEVPKNAGALRFHVSFAVPSKGTAPG